MGKRLRKKNKEKKKNRNKKQSQLKEINAISKQIENLVLVETDDDFISKLRDDILCHILSLVPLRCAVQTSSLSTRWKNVWRKSIEFQGAIEDFPMLITLLLDDPFDRKIRFLFSQGSILATIKGNEQLHLNFCNGGQEMFSHFDLNLELNPLNPVFDFPSCIKVLHLKSTNKVTKEIVSSIISKFQFLETLQISECKGLQSLYIEAGSRFKSLIILDCLQLNEIYVFAYNLKKLVFQGQLPWFWLKYSPHLETAILDFRYGPGYNPFACENLLCLLLSVQNVKALTISAWLFKVPISKWLSSAGAIWERKDFSFNNLKELCWIDSSMENHSVTTLISILKICPSLEKLLINVDPSHYCSPSKGECRFWKEYSHRVANTTTLDHLNVIKLKGCLDDEDEILLTKRLVAIASVQMIHVK